MSGTDSRYECRVCGRQFKTFRYPAKCPDCGTEVKHAPASNELGE